MAVGDDRTRRVVQTPTKVVVTDAAVQVSALVDDTDDDFVDSGSASCPVNLPVVLAGLRKCCSCSSSDVRSVLRKQLRRTEPQRDEAVRYAVVVLVECQVVL